MRQLRVLFAALGLASALMLFQNFTTMASSTDPTCDSQSDVSTSLGKDTFYQFTHSASGGRTRSYIVHVPVNYVSTTPTDVVFVLHGGFGTACQIRLESKVNDLPQRYGKKNWPYIAVYPNGVSDPNVYGDRGQHWNDGRVENPQVSIDDVDFIHQILDRLTSVHKFNINQQRVFTVGVSNGGMMAFRLARDSSRMTAVTTISALIPENLVKSGTPALQGIPVMMIQGTSDSIMPWNGGPVDSQVSGNVLSAMDSYALIKKSLGSPPTTVTSYYGEALSPGVTRVDWYHQDGWALGVRNMKRAEMIKIVGSGHCWPGPDAAIRAKSGDICARGVDASFEAIAFFQTQPSLPLVYVNKPVGGGFPHRADFLYPKMRNASTRVIVALHGGGGTKHGFAYSLGLKNQDTTQYDSGYNAKFLEDNNVVLVFVQGQHIPQKPDSFTWSNTVMTSGQDDKAMLVKLASDLRRQGFAKVYLFGHSMGGVMANRMWCQSSKTFDGYGSSAGPMSVNLFKSCVPSALRPYIHVAGLNDRIIQLVEDRKVGPSIAHLDDETLTLDPTTRTLGGYIGGSAFVHPVPEFQNELMSYADRVASVCQKTPSAPVLSPTGLSWETKTQTDCSGKLRLIQVRGADHCTGGSEASGGYKCDVPLTQLGTLNHLVRFVKFFTAL